MKAGAGIKTQAGSWPALMFASKYNQNVEVITTLLKAGAEINVRDNAALTPLMIAASNNKNPAVIAALL